MRVHEEITLRSKSMPGIMVRDHLYPARCQMPSALNLVYPRLSHARSPLWDRFIVDRRIGFIQTRSVGVHAVSIPEFGVCGYPLHAAFRMGGAWRSVWQGGQRLGFRVLMLEGEAVEVLFEIGGQIGVGITRRVGQGEVPVGGVRLICSWRSSRWVRWLICRILFETASTWTRLRHFW